MIFLHAAEEIHELAALYGPSAVALSGQSGDGGTVEAGRRGIQGTTCGNARNPESVPILCFPIYN